MNTSLQRAKSLSKVRKQLKQIKFDRRDYDDLTEATCAPGTWAYLNGQIGVEEAQRIDREAERKRYV